MEQNDVHDPVRAYLERKGYASYIVEGGVPYLLTSWESTVAAIAGGDILEYTSYVRSMDRRRMLEETLSLIPTGHRDIYQSRVQAADQRISPHLTRTALPLCGSAVAIERGYAPEREWWYYHRPRMIDATWPDDV